VKMLISTAAARRSGSRNAKFTFKRTSPANHFRTDRWASECRTALSVKIFTQET